jgi:hypothetical protein
MTNITGQRQNFWDSIFKSGFTLNKRGMFIYSFFDWNTQNMHQADIECSQAGLANLNPQEDHIFRSGPASLSHLNTCICKHICYIFVYQSCLIIFCKPFILGVSNCIIETFHVYKDRKYFPQWTQVGQSCCNAWASKRFMAKGHNPYCGLVRGPHVGK